MSLSPLQLTALKADILANTNPIVVQALQDGAMSVVAGWYNETAVPESWIWKSDGDAAEVEENGFIWGQVDNMTGKQERIWNWLRDRNIDATKGNVRIGINQAFTKDSSLWDSVMVHLSRLATNAEKVLAVGENNGLGQGIPSTSDDKPRNPGFEGAITYQEIAAALNS